MGNVVWFCSKCHKLSSSAKKNENRLRFDKVTESLKVGTFLRHSVVMVCLISDHTSVVLAFVEHKEMFTYLRTYLFSSVCLAMRSSGSHRATETESRTYVTPDLQPHNFHNVAYDVIPENSENLASSSTFQTTAAAAAAAPKSSVDAIYAAVNKNQRSSARASDRDSYANLPGEQSAPITTQQVYSTQYDEMLLICNL